MKKDNLNDEEILNKVREHHKKGNIEITRSGILGNDFKTTDGSFEVKATGTKRSDGLNNYTILRNGVKDKNSYNLAETYREVLNHLAFF